jgi:hypothetical protein
MRYQSFLGSMNPKTQKMRKQMGKCVKSGKYVREWYDDPSRRPPIATLSPRVTHIIGNHVNHQGEIRQKV